MDIDRVGIVDDTEDERETLVDVFEYAKMKATSWDGPFKDVGSLVANVTSTDKAVVCDHHLTAGYANFRGAEAVAGFYQQGFPAILRTAWTQVELIGIRKFRRFIPVLFRDGEIELDEFLQAWDICTAEFNGDFTTIRKPWRVRARIEDVFDNANNTWVRFVLPGWNSQEVIEISLDMAPANMRDDIKKGRNFYADVNKGAEDQVDLYFENYGFEK